MTMGSKCVFLNSLTTPTLRVTPPMEGNWSRTIAEQSSPLRRGGGHAAGVVIARAYSAPVIAKEYDQRWKRWRTTVAIQCNMSAGICPQCFFIYWIATLRSR